MARKKLKRIQEVKTFENVIEVDKDDIKAVVNTFLNTETSARENAAKVFLELGCGKGEYTIAYAKKYLNARCIGVDIQGERIWVGAKLAIDEKLDNVLFVRCFVEHLASIIPAHSVDEIWLPFPDPHPTKGGERKRLTSKKYHDLYKKILKNDGIVHFKTDDEVFYEYSTDILSIYGAHITMNKRIDRKIDEKIIETDIQTYYQQKNVTQSEKIFYLQWKY